MEITEVIFWVVVVIVLFLAGHLLTKGIFSYLVKVNEFTEDDLKRLRDEERGPS